MKCVICHNKIGVDTHKVAKDEECCSAICMGRLHAREQHSITHLESNGNFMDWKPGTIMTADLWAEFLDSIGAGEPKYQPGVTEEDFLWAINSILGPQRGEK